MTCTYCQSTAIVFCKSHRRYMCGDRDCAGYHRLAFRPDLCHVVDAKPSTWRTHVLRTAVALAVGLLITWIVAL